MTDLKPLLLVTLLGCTPALATPALATTVGNALVLLAWASVGQPVLAPNKAQKRSLYALQIGQR